MKTSGLWLGLIFLPMTLNAAIRVAPRTVQPKLDDIPAQFLTDSETRTIEWGCPVSDFVEASTKSEAIQKMTAECVDQVKQAATEKPEVVDVLETSVIWPDLQVVEAHNGYSLTGTFFVKTLVLQRGGR